MTQIMPEAIADLSPQAVIEAIETNLVDSSAVMGRTEDGVVYRGQDVTWVYTGFPSLSRVLRARFTDESAEDRVQEILAYFKQWDASVSWVLGPSSWPLSLAQTLHAHGFGSGETWTGMAMDLRNGPQPVATPDGLRIGTASDDAGMKTWAGLSAEAQSQNGFDGASGIFTPDNAGGDPRCRYYIGYLDEQPVSRDVFLERRNGRHILANDAARFQRPRHRIGHRPSGFGRCRQGRREAGRDARSAGRN